MAALNFRALYDAAPCENQQRYTSGGNDIQLYTVRLEHITISCRSIFFYNVFKAPRFSYTVDYWMTDAMIPAIERHGGQAVNAEVYYGPPDRWFALFTTEEHLLSFIVDHWEDMPRQSPALNK